MLDLYSRIVGIVKRFLDALKAESFSQDVFPAFMEALTSLVKCNLTAEVFRSLALFITYAYHQGGGTVARIPNKSQTVTGLNRLGTLSGGPKRPTINTLVDVREASSRVLTKRQLGTKILEMYTDLLCEKGSTSNIKKFARTVTNKVVHDT